MDFRHQESVELLFAQVPQSKNPAPGVLIEILEVRVGALHLIGITWF